MKLSFSPSLAAALFLGVFLFVSSSWGQEEGALLDGWFSELGAERRELEERFDLDKAAATLEEAFGREGISGPYAGDWGRWLYSDWDSASALYDKARAGLERLRRSVKEEGPLVGDELRAVEEHRALLDRERDLLFWLFEERVRGLTERARYLEQLARATDETEKATRRKRADAWDRHADAASEELRALGRRADFRPLEFAEEGSFETIGDEELDGYLKEYKRVYALYKKARAAGDIQDAGRWRNALRGLAYEIRRLGGQLPSPLPGRKKHRPAPSSPDPAPEGKPGRFRMRTPLPPDTTPKEKAAIRAAEDAILRHTQMSHSDWVAAWRKKHPDVKEKGAADYLAAVAWNGELDNKLLKLHRLRTAFAMSRSGRDETGEDARLLGILEKNRDRVRKLGRKWERVSAFKAKNDKLFELYKKWIAWLKVQAGGEGPDGNVDTLFKGAQYLAMVNSLRAAKKLRRLGNEQHELLERGLEVAKRLQKRKLNRGLKAINDALGGTKRFDLLPERDYVRSGRPALRQLLDDAAWDRFIRGAIQRRRAFQNRRKSSGRRPRPVPRGRSEGIDRARRRVRSARPRY